MLWQQRADVVLLCSCCICGLCVLGERTNDSVTAEELAALDEAAQARSAKRAAHIEALRMSQDELRTVTAAKHASVMDRIRAKLGGIHMQLKEDTAAELARLLAEARAEGQVAGDPDADGDDHHADDYEIEVEDGAQALDQEDDAPLAGGDAGTDESKNQAAAVAAVASDGDADHDSGTEGVSDIRGAAGTSNSINKNGASTAGMNGTSQGGAMDVDGDAGSDASSGDSDEGDSGSSSADELEIAAPTATQMLMPGAARFSSVVFGATGTDNKSVTTQQQQQQQQQQRMTLPRGFALPVAPAANKARQALKQQLRHSSIHQANDR